MANKLGETSPQKQQNLQQQQQYDAKNQCKNGGTTTTATVTNTNSCMLNSSSTNSNEIDTSTASFSDSNTVRQQKPILAHGKLNDLVADLCLNNTRGHQNLNNGAPDVFIDNINNCALNASAIVNNSSYSNAITTTTTSSSFSFKHFLSNNSRDMAAPSSTVTSLDPIITAANANGQTNMESAVVTTTTTTTTNNNTSTTSGGISDPNTAFQTSTGARPKIPQSTSVSTSSICTLMSHTRISEHASPDHLAVAPTVKMKRSPRFSSFDSQASLAEYAGATRHVEEAGFFNAEGKPKRLYDTNYRPDDLFNNGTNSSSDMDLRGKCVPRSYSNYDLQPSTSPKRRIAVINLDENSDPDTAFGCFLQAQSSGDSLRAEEGAIGGDSAAAAAGGAGGGGGGGSETQETINVMCADSTQSEFGNSAASSAAAGNAAALPDFVQDHWLESWQVQDSMRVNSPATSPVTTDANTNNTAAGFGLTSTLRGRLAPAKLALAKNATGMNLGAPTFCGVIGDKRNSGQSQGNTVSPSTSSLRKPAEMEDPIDVPNPFDPNNLPPMNLDIGVHDHLHYRPMGKILPDFLTDRPNMHTLQRLADVAAGLPSNSVGSPDETLVNPMAILRHDNMCLQNKLSEAIQKLDEERRRYVGLELDYQELHQQFLLQQQQFKNEQQTNDDNENTTTKNNTANSNNNNSGGENDEKSSKSNAESEIVALRLHISDLTMELEKLRSENTILREGGAVGGVAAASGGAGATAGRNFRTQQQISRDLLNAAANAESNLKQLLSGVENLRKLANEVENNDWPAVQSAEMSPDLYPDYFEDVDAIYDEFRNGPPF